MGDEIDIEEWSRGMIAEIEMFRDAYKDANKQYPVGYPSTMIEGEWDEQFSIYQDTGSV